MVNSSEGCKDEPEESKIKTKSNMSLLEKFNSKFTVELIMLFYITSSMMSSLTTENLNLEKSCQVNIGYNDSVCDAMVVRNRSGYTDHQEIQVQKLVSSMLAWKTAIQGVIPFVLMLFLGPWSDKYKKRKLFILMPIIGESISTLGYILCTYYFREWSVEYAIFFEAVPVSITGGWFCFFVGVYTYIAENSSKTSRTVRIGAASTATHISLTSGIALSGVIFRFLGFYGVYTLSILVFSFTIVYGLMFIKDGSSTCIDKKQNRTMLKEAFDPRNVSKIFSICFKEDSKRRRMKLWLIMILVLLLVGVYRGELIVLYMFTRRKYTWDEVDYSAYNTYHSATQMLGCFICLTIFADWMKVDDATLGMIGMMSKFVSCFASGFAPTPIYYYLAALTEIFNGSSHMAMRSIMSKLVGADELGQTFSIFGLCEALTPLLFGPLYSIVYHKTVDLYPSAFYALSATCHLAAFFVFLLLYQLRDKDIVEQFGGHEILDVREEELHTTKRLLKSGKESMLSSKM